MRKTTKLLIIMVGMVISLAIMSLPSFAEKETPKLPAEPMVPAPQPPIPIPRPRTEADLGVKSITAGTCKSDLSDVDAIYMSDIIVEVGKKDIYTTEAARRDPSRVVGYLSVTYHDLLAGRLVTQRSVLRNNDFGGPGTLATITVVRNPVLVKRSVGIRAEIRLNSPGYADVDPNRGNNVMITRNCEIYLR